MHSKYVYIPCRGEDISCLCNNKFFPCSSVVESHWPFSCSKFCKERINSYICRVAVTQVLQISVQPLQRKRVPPWPSKELVLQARLNQPQWKPLSISVLWLVQSEWNFFYWSKVVLHGQTQDYSSKEGALNSLLTVQTFWWGRSGVTMSHQWVRAAVPLWQWHVDH